MQESVDADGKVQRNGKIVDVGDLSTYTSFRIVEAKGKSIDASSVKMESIVDVEKLLAGMK